MCILPKTPKKIANRGEIKVSDHAPSMPIESNQKKSAKASLNLVLKESIRKNSYVLKPTPVETSPEKSEAIVATSTVDSEALNKKTLDAVVNQNKSDQESISQCVSDDSDDSIRKESDIVKTTIVATSTVDSEALDQETLDAVVNQKNSDAESLNQCVSEDSDETIRKDSNIVKTATVAQVSEILMPSSFSNIN